MRKDIIPYYRALGLSPGAEPVEIRRAYRQMIQQWHPDLYKPGSPMQTTAEDITKEINEAYDQLYRKKLYRNFSAKRDAKADSEKDSDREPKGSSGAREGDDETPRARKGRAGTGSQARILRWTQWARRSGNHWAVSAAVFALAAVLAPLWRIQGNPGSLTAIVPNFGKATWAADETAKTAAAPTPEGKPAESPIGERVGEHPGSVTGSLPKSTRAVAIEPTKYVRSDAALVMAKAEELLNVFEQGDTKARVLEIQGAPDEAGENIFRYGSSVVYFADGRVKGWLDRRPRLRVRDWSAQALPGLDTFWKGSSRGDVVRAQGMPLAFDSTSYTYGSSVVLFDQGQVSGWSEGDTRLRQFEMPSLPFMDLDRLQLIDSRTNLEF